MSAGALVAAFVVFLLKTLAVLVSIAILESIIAKLRIFRVPDLLFTSFIMSFIAILLVVL